MTKRLLQFMVVGALLIVSLLPMGGAKAWYGCGGYVTVQWGDTLSSLASLCGTTVDAILSYNPGLGWWLYAGQVIYVPAGTTSYVSYPSQYSTGHTYVVQAGDTMGIIAARYGITVYQLWLMNPQIWDPSLIYAGQVINVPATSYAYPTPPPVVTYPSTYPPANQPSSTTLKVTYKKGLYIRNSPGGSIIGWATYDEFKDWCYYPSSITRDSVGKVWVQVDLIPAQHGYSIGWMLVKDQYGNLFTSLNPGW